MLRLTHLNHRMRTRGGRGFTLVELMVVIAILTILLAIAAPIYRTTIIHAREAVLRDDLYQMRTLIGQYTLDKQAAPQTLQDLVTAGYLRQLPVDPFTRSSSTWVPVTDDSIMSLSQQQPGIVDVHSGSQQTSLEGTPYSSW